MSHKNKRQFLPSIVLSFVLLISLTITTPLGTNLLLGAPLMATNVSGVVNSYAPVTNVSGNAVTIGAITGAGTPFAIGDYALLIQMTGAPPPQGGSFGLYEMKQVTAVAGSAITLQSVDNTYEFATEAVQLVRAPFDDSLTVTGNVTALPWNGSTGGVIALKGDTLTMNADIDASASGYRAGAFNGSLSSASYAVGTQPDDSQRVSLSSGQGATDGRGTDGSNGSGSSGAGGGGLGGGGGDGGTVSFSSAVAGAGGGAGGSGAGGEGDRGDAFGSASDGDDGSGTGGGGGSTLTVFGLTFGGGSGGGGGVIGGGGGGGGSNTGTGSGSGGGGGGVDGGGGGGVSGTVNSDSVVSAGGGGGTNSPGNGSNAACTDSCGAAGGGSYGGGGGGLGGGYRGGDDVSGAGGGGSWSGGGARGIAGGGVGVDGGAGNTAVSVAITETNHYLNDTNPRLMMGGSGGSAACVQGGAGGGIVFLDFDSVTGNGNSILANGDTPAPSPSGSGGSYSSCTVLNNSAGGGGAGGAGGGGGGQMRLSVSTWNNTVVQAAGGNGGDAGNSNGSGTRAHGGGGGGAGGGGGVWFDEVLNPTGGGSNTGGQTPVVPGVDWSGLGSILGGTPGALTNNPKNNLDTGRGGGGGNGLIVVSQAAPTASLGSFVWEDTSNDGIQDVGESGIISATVRLLDGSGNVANDVDGNPVATQTTAANGLYYFDNLAAGSYIVEVTPPSGYMPSAIQATGAINGSTSTNVAENDSNIDNSPAVGDYRSGVITLTVGSEPTEGGTFAGDAQDDASGDTNGNMTVDFGFNSIALPEIDIAKIVNTPPTVTVGSAISFTIRITNTGSVTITNLPLTDTYDIAYLSYDTVADASSPNPATEATNDGEILWSNVIDFDPNNQLDPTETLDLTVWFIAAAETTALPGGASTCDGAGNTYNNATANGETACAQVPIDPPEPKLTLGDVIWHDINNDGTQDANEPGINGVLVNLYEVTGAGNTLITSTTTISNGVNGFYQFDVESGKTYQVEVDSSNFTAGGPLAGYVVAANQPDITDDAAPDQTEVNVTTNVNTLDFGFYCEFDLALDKKLSGANPIAPGDDVTFTITVYNQGTVTATSATVADYIPNGFTLSGANGVTWTGGPTGTVTTTVAGPLTAGMSTTVDIVLTAGAALSGIYTNTAEIAAHESSVKDALGADLPDADSTPDATDGNGDGESTNLEDDQVGEDGKNVAGDDEDDHDPAQVTVMEVVTTCQQFMITLDGGQEVPAVNTPATGSGWVQIDPVTNELTYYIEYSGLTGTETMAHIHGFAPRGSNAGVLSTLPADSPKSGTFVYDEADEADLLAGLAYFNIHTDAFPGGEIRGQIDGETTACVSLEVDKQLNGDNPFMVGEEISYTIRITNTGHVTITELPLVDRYNDVFISSPTASVTPDSNDPGVIVWNDLTTALGNLAPDATMSLIVTFTTAADTTLLTPVAPCTSSGHAPNIVDVENAIANPGGDGGNGNGDPNDNVMVPEDHDCAEVAINNPTAVTLAARGISQTPDGVLVRWETVSESDIVGFHIWKSSGVDAEQRSGEMIVAQNAGQSSAASYEWLDGGASLSRGDTYILEIVNNDGSTERVVIDVMNGGMIYLPILMN